MVNLQPGHIRAARQARGGNSFYRDKSDRTSAERTLCGAPVTEKDLDFIDGARSVRKADGWPICAACSKAVR